MQSDPSDSGGLFVGRRSGTAPVRFRGSPERGSAGRRRADSMLAGAMLVAMTVLSLLCWGPIPIACLWVGSEVQYVSGSVSLGILLAFVALAALLFGTLALLRRIDHAWVLVRRAAGHEQPAGVLGRIFAATAVVCATAFVLWFLLVNGPGSTISSGGGTP